ncbi:Mu-like prophage major head subunit gpT family protein [Tianweitania sediminis]|uniref:Mu-like prophage major head subunit gpT family protein n=1 Tax=Tianweitania sediminis TaxID=1502156 RepID=A0A8J7UK23_9HYPH|nr:Mu-like prophage major head subunit gpT family protein [Tianweitania sediminis]MBP0439440.1 Mu-like prophage major head subunit gpT family protein [Tianweitania sediminis]
MKITSGSLNALRVGFKTNFQGGLSQAASQYARVATVVPSSTREERYGWLSKLPNIREWIGDRVIQNVSEADYSIRNKSFEMTIAVERDDIRDDTLGTYAPLFTEMGMSVAAFPDQLVWPLLKNGFTTKCYDGQFFFDTDHPVLDENGNEISVSNSGGGSGEGWYLLCTKRAIKPIIYQEREKFDFVALDSPDDPNVFNKKQFVYGVEGRANAGFGFWQFAYGSKQTLNEANYAAARAAITGMKGDYGRPLGLVPDLLVVPPSLEGAGKAILQSQLVNGGESNKWAGSAELLMTPWLA